MNELIREAAWTDLAAIQQLEKLVFKENAFIGDRWTQYYRASKRCILVAVVDGQLAGFILGVVRHQDGEIISIGVAPRSRRTGIGTHLIHRILDMLRREGCTSVEATVRADAPEVLRFYERNGFTRTAPGRWYYSGTCAGIVVTYSLVKC